MDTVVPEWDPPGVLSLVVARDLESVELSSRNPLIRLLAGNLERTGLILSMKEEWVRVGLGSRGLGLKNLGRWALIAVSDRGLLVRRVAIPSRVPSGVDSVGVDRLGTTADESTTDPSVRRVEPKTAGSREDGIV